MTRYHEEADPTRLLDAYPIGAGFESRVATRSVDELRAVQEMRFRAVVERAWQIPFYLSLIHI